MLQIIFKYYKLKLHIEIHFIIYFNTKETHSAFLFAVSCNCASLYLTEEYS